MLIGLVWRDHIPLHLKAKSQILKPMKFSNLFYVGLHYAWSFLNIYIYYMYTYIFIQKICQDVQDDGHIMGGGPLSSRTIVPEKS